MSPHRWWVHAVTVVLVALGSGCPNPMPEPEPEPEAEEPYEGPSSSGIPPAIDPDDYDFDAGVVLVDAGSVVVDTRCCVTRFSISDQEPADATGVIEGDLPVFAGGTPLTREDGGWTATVCHPLNASGYYWYRFVWDGGLFDGGTETQPDGGEAPVLIPVTATSVRASDRETSVTNSQGTRNFYREVSSCDGLGGRVP